MALGGVAARLGVLLAFAIALAIAIETKADGQSEDLGGCPKRQAYDQTQDDPVVPPTDELDGLAGQERIVMHAGAEQVEAAFATERVVESEQHRPLRDEGGEQEPRQDQAEVIESPGVMTEEAMKSRPMADADLIAAIDEFRDIAMSHGRNPAGHQGQKDPKTGLRENRLKGTQQRLKAVGKMFHGRPSLASGKCENLPLCQGGRPSNQPKKCET
jgi:hypothetical protein